MWIVILLLFSAYPTFAEQGFDPKYERDYNVFNPLNPANRYNHTMPFALLNGSQVVLTHAWSL